MKTNAQNNTVFKYICYRQNWHLYKEGVYVPISDDDMDALVMGYLREIHPEHATINMQANVIANLNSCDVAHVPSHIQMPVRRMALGQFEPMPGVIVMGNCVIDFEKTARAMFLGEDIPRDQFILSHSPKIISTTKVNYPFEPGADCPLFKKYLRETVIDADKILQIQMLFGLAFVAVTKYNVIIIFYGDGGTGKTVTIHVLTNVVGQDNTCCVPIRCFATRFSLYPLTTKLLNIVGELDAETENSSSLASVETILKTVSDGGIVRVEQKNKDAYDAPAVARNVFATNYIPPFTDRTDGIWDRLRIIPFEKRFRDTDQEDRDLRYKIVQNELPGVFMWAMEGYAELLKIGRFPESSRGLEIKKKHRLNCDHEKMFLESTYEFTGVETNFIESEQAYKTYREWMMHNGFRGVRHAANFSDAVEKTFKSVGNRRKTFPDKTKKTCWIGLKIKVEGTDGQAQ